MYDVNKQNISAILGLEYGLHQEKPLCKKIAGKQIVGCKKMQQSCNVTAKKCIEENAVVMARMAILTKQRKRLLADNYDEQVPSRQMIEKTIGEIIAFRNRILNACQNLMVPNPYIHAIRVTCRQMIGQVTRTMTSTLRQKGIKVTPMI